MKAQRWEAAGHMKGSKVVQQEQLGLVNLSVTMGNGRKAFESRQQRLKHDCYQPSKKDREIRAKSKARTKAKGRENVVVFKGKAAQRSKRRKEGAT